MKIFKRFLGIIKTNKTLSKNLVLTIILRVVALLVSFFTTSFYMSYFKDEIALGVWFTILSILNWVLNFDLGIGNGVRNELAKYYDKDEDKARKIITSAYVSLGFLCLAIFFTFELVSLFLDWNTILNVSSISGSTLKLAISISILGICLQLWFRTINSVFYAMQKVIFPDICALVSNILIVLFLFVFKKGDSEQKLLFMSGWYAISLSLPLLVLTIIGFLKIVPNIRPKKGFFDKETAKLITSLGANFFLIQISLLVMNSTNQWLISFLCKPEMVVEYQVYFKVFEIAITVFSLFTQPVWSAVTHAKREGKFKWIKNAYLFMLGIAVCGVVCCIVVAFLLQHVFNFWLRENTIESNFKTAMLFVLLVGIQMFIYASTCISNGLNELKVQIIWTPICAVLKIPLAFLFYHFIQKWEAVVLAFCICQIPLLVAEVISLVNYFQKNRVDLSLDESYGK